MGFPHPLQGWLRYQQLPFLACPGGQNPLPGPPCGRTTTPGSSGMYTAHPVSTPEAIAKAMMIFFMLFPEAKGPSPLRQSRRC